MKKVNLYAITNMYEIYSILVICDFINALICNDDYYINVIKKILKKRKFVYVCK